MGAFESHLSYDFKPGFWVSLDGNFWVGGSTSVTGVENPLTKQKTLVLEPPVQSGSASTSH